jgi:tetratricopeptide (TPR) repeat protein
MSPNMERALLLFQQGRFEMAEGELRQALANSPEDSHAHALLGLCLSEREKFTDATQEAQQAILLAPDFPFAHYAMAHVMHDRHRNEEALQAIGEAIRLDPTDADYLAVLSQIQLDQRNWPAALEAAERGLQHNPEHVGCTNLRAIALVKLGRREEAGATIDAALRKAPENSVTHANQGWTLLEKGESKKALEHFKESLRLNPENEWARQGIVEALKARHFIYAVMLKYFLWMSRLSRQAQWGVLIGAYLGNRFLSLMGNAKPEWRPWFLPIQITYLCFMLMTWIASPLFNLLLRLNRFGRMALSREQIVASNWIGLALLIALLSLVGALLLPTKLPLLLVALVFGSLLLPISGTFNCAEGWPRNIMALFTGAMATAGIAGVVAFGVGEINSGTDRSLLKDGAMVLIGICVIGAALSSWVSNFLAMQRPRR